MTTTGKRILTKDPKPLLQNQDTTLPDYNYNQKGPEIPTKTQSMKPRRSTRSGRDLRPFDPKTHKRVETIKHMVNRVRQDQDHPTDQQARESPIAHEWAKARQVE